MTRRRLTALLAGLMLPLLWSTAAFAHAVLQPAAAPAGEATEFQLLIPHGCSEGEPPPPPGSEVVDTRLISLEIPEGVTIDAVADVEGFEIEQTDEAVTWTGTLANEDPGELFFTATFDGEDGTEVPFNVYQECNDELNYRWTGDHDAATPAPVVTVGGDPAAGHDMEEMTEGEDDHEMAEGEEMAMDDASEAADMADEAASEDAMADMAATEGAATEDSATEVAMDMADEDSDDEATPEGAVATGAGGTDGGSSTPWIIGGAAALIAGAGALVMGRRRV
ncbi:DUF1775 domain-containing protein [Euzebya pacifica]|uniref:DUF1775 domain-containing protein n=1 Tax=Euzebya pacifica TaxID=1608957 RepID=UPI0030FB39C3